jgi:hypothetical protein
MVTEVIAPPVSRFYRLPHLLPPRLRLPPPAPDGAGARRHVAEEYGCTVAEVSAILDQHPIELAR